MTTHAEVEAAQKAAQECNCPAMVCEHIAEYERVLTAWFDTLPVPGRFGQS